MADTAEVLARPEVQKQIGELIIAAGATVDLKYQHAKAMSMALVDRIASGEPLAPAVALVDDIRKGIVETMGWNGCLTGDCPHATQAECDKAIADEVRALVAEPS